METRARYLIVGFFVLASMVGVVGVIIWLSGANLKTTNISYDIFFKGAVNGLRIGNPVRYRGVQVGSVTDIAINPDNVEEVRVIIQVPDITPIKTDTVASLEYQGITGVAYVQLSGGTNEAERLTRKEGQKHAVISSKPSQMEQLFNQAPELISRFIGLVDKAEHLLSEKNRANLEQTLSNMQTFSGALAGQSENVSNLVSDSAATIKQLRTTMVEVDGILKSMSERGNGVADNLDKTLVETQDLVRDLRKASDKITFAADQAGQMIQENRGSLSEFSTNGLYELTNLVSEARTLVSTLSRIANELERDPARFIFSNTDQGYQAK